MGIVRIIRGGQRFITDHGIEHADFPVNAVAQRGAQRDIGLADGEIRRAAVGVDRGRAERVRIGPEPQVNMVASRPFALIERFVERELNDVQVETVGLAGTAKGIRRGVNIAGSQVPLG